APVSDGHVAVLDAGARDNPGPIDLEQGRHPARERGLCDQGPLVAGADLVHVRAHDPTDHLLVEAAADLRRAGDDVRNHARTAPQTAAAGAVGAALALSAAHTDGAELADADRHAVAAAVAVA